MEVNNLEKPDNEQAQEQLIINEAITKRNLLLGSRDRIVAVNERIFDICARLKKTYLDAEECYLFHVLKGSTKKRKLCTRLDFPGKDSIVNILDELLEEFKVE